MRQAIVTTYKGPTETRGSRIVARCDARRMTVPYDHALDAEANHVRAAAKLASALEWSGGWNGGGMPGGRGYVFVCENGGGRDVFTIAGDEVTYG